MDADERLKLLIEFSKQALPEVMANYRLLELELITYDMDTEHTDRIAEQAFAVGKAMLRKLEWDKDCDEVISPSL